MPQTQTFAEKVTAPPPDFALKEENRKVYLDEEQRSVASAKLHALLMSVSVALSLIRSKQAGNNSPELANLETCYTLLQGNAASLLSSLEHPETAINQLDVLIQRQGSLSTLLQSCQTEGDKIELQQTSPASPATPEALALALANQPLMQELDFTVQRLSAIREMNRLLSRHVAATQEGMNDFATVLDIAKVANTQEAVIAAVEKVEKQMADAAFLEDLENGLTHQEMMAKSEQVKMSIRQRAIAIFEAANDLKSGFSKEKIKNAYQRFVEAPSTRLAEKYAICRANMGEFMSEHCSTMRNITSHLKQRFGAFNQKIDNATTITDLATMFETSLAEMQNSLGECMQDITCDANAINETIAKTTAKQEMLRGLLTGEHDNIKEAAKLLDMEVKELARQVGEFRAYNGIPSLPVISLFSQVREALGIKNSDKSRHLN